MKTIFVGMMVIRAQGKEFSDVTLGLEVTLGLSISMKIKNAKGMVVIRALDKMRSIAVLG